MEKRKLIYFKSEDAKAQKRSLTEEGTGTEQPCLVCVFILPSRDPERTYRGRGSSWQDPEVKAQQVERAGTAGSALWARATSKGLLHNRPAIRFPARLGIVSLF